MVKVVSDQPQAFAETLIMNDLALTEIADWITDFRIFDQTQNIVVGQTRFLLCRHVFVHVSNRVARRLNHRCAPRLTGSGLWPKSNCMIYIIWCKPLLLQFFRREVFRQLVNNRADHFHVGEFLRSDVSQNPGHLTVHVRITLGQIAHCRTDLSVGTSVSR